jgi:hypothetical protein
VWTWLIAVALASGVAPVPARAQYRGAPAASPQAQGSSHRLVTPRLAGAALFGLPTEYGRVRWPFGLESLTPSDEAQALRDRVELVLDVVAEQAAEGQVNRVLIDFGAGAVRDLRQLLKDGERSMHPKTYAEAARFLDRAERGLTRLKAGENSPGKLKTAGPSPSGVYP